MKRKGIDFRKAPHLHWRYFLPGDCGELRGDRFARAIRAPHLYQSYVVIIRQKDILDDDDGCWDDNLKRVRAVPFSGWVRTNMVLGLWRSHGYGSHWTRPIYWVEDNIVYRGSERIYWEPKGP